MEISKKEETHPAVDVMKENQFHKRN